MILHLRYIRALNSNKIRKTIGYELIKKNKANPRKKLVFGLSKIKMLKKNTKGHKIIGSNINQFNSLNLSGSAFEKQIRSNAI